MRYFAYGTNMDAAGMRQRCPGATLIGTERLAGYRFVIARAGYAGLVPDPASDVLGVLWSLTPDDVLGLDAYEGIAEGLYRKATMTVAGGPALVYVPADYSRGTPKPGYLATVIAAARSHGLPDDYVRELESWT
jgi:gamma-glutamylcyclotransferase (GGCT)/AIG2-like uncharacterized protein YtfP